MKAFKFILVIFCVFLLGYLQNNAQSVISRQSKAKTTTTEKKNASPKKNVSKKSKQLGSNSQTNKNKSKEQPITISAPDGYLNGHGYVDLGLPSGTKWATCNIGASTPQDYGNYYAWGDIDIKSEYTISNCMAKDIGSYGNEKFTKGWCDNLNNLKTIHDAASMNWGSLWRMPTAEELKELYEKCTWSWINYKGKNGYRCVGPNGNSIFLPTAGYYFEISLYDTNRCGWYRSATFNGVICTYALKFSADKVYVQEYSSDRYYGCSVRPVIRL